MEIVAEAKALLVLLAEQGGRAVYEIDGAINEPDIPREISVVVDGPLWVTGGIPVTRSDGIRLEIRNRITLCRCGRSDNKPL